MALQHIGATLNVETMVMMPDARNKKRVMDEERAWRSHDRQQLLVPWSVKCRVDDFTKSLTAPAAIVEQHLANPDRLIAPCLGRRSKRKAALQNLIRALPGAAVDGDKDMVVIKWLTYHGHILNDIQHPGEAQNCVLVRVAIFHREFGGATQWQSWLVEFPVHSLGRLWESDPKADMRACLFAAANHFAAGDTAEIMHRLKIKRSVYLPCGDGLFVCDVLAGKIKGSEHVVVYARARTYLSGNKIWPDQIPLPPATSPANSMATLALTLARAPTGHRDYADPFFGRDPKVALAIDAALKRAGYLDGGDKRSKNCVLCVT